jgi:hypothetical protein
MKPPKFYLWRDSYLAGSVIMALAAVSSVTVILVSGRGWEWDYLPVGIGSAIALFIEARRSRGASHPRLPADAVIAAGPRGRSIAGWVLLGGSIVVASAFMPREPMNLVTIPVFAALGLFLGAVTLVNGERARGRVVYVRASWKPLRGPRHFVTDNEHPPPAG